VKGLPQGSTTTFQRGVSAPSNVQARNQGVAQRAAYQQAVVAQQQADAQFVADNLQLDTGEWVPREYFNALNHEQQVYLKAAGVEKFNSRQSQLQKASASLTSNGQIDIIAAIEAGKEDELKALGVSKQEIGQAKTFIQSNVKIGGSWISKSDYNTMPAEDQQRIQDVGIQKFTAEKQAENEAFIKNNVKIGDKWIAKSDYDAMSPQDRAHITEIGVDRFTKEFEDNNVKIGDKWIPKEYYNTLDAADQQHLQDVGIDKFTAEIDAKNAEIKVVEDKMSSSKYKTADGYYWVLALADNVVNADELVSARFIKPEEKANALQQAQDWRDTEAALAKIDNSTYKDKDKPDFYNLQKIQYDEVLSPRELVLVFAQTPEGKQQLLSVLKESIAHPDSKALAAIRNADVNLKAASIAKTVLDFTLPGYGTQRHWSEMGQGGKLFGFAGPNVKGGVLQAISIAGDLAFFLPMVGWAAKAGFEAKSAAALTRIMPTAAEAIAVAKGGAVAARVAEVADVTATAAKEINAAKRIANVARSAGFMVDRTAEGLIRFPVEVVVKFPAKLLSKPGIAIADALKGAKGFAEIAVYPMRHPIQSAEGLKYLFGGKQALGEPILSKLVGISTLRAADQQGTTIWRGLQIDQRPIVGKSGGKLVLGVKDIDVSGVNVSKLKPGIEESYVPEQMLETRIMADEATLRRLGASDAEIAKMRTTLAERSSIMGRRSPATPNEVTFSPIKYLNDAELNVVMEEYMKNVASMDKFRGSGAMRAQLAEEVKSLRAIHDVDISTKMNSEKTREFAEALLQKMQAVSGKENLRLTKGKTTIIEKKIDGAWHHSVDIKASGEDASGFSTALGDITSPKTTYGVVHQRPALEIKYKGLGKIRLVRLDEVMADKVGVVLGWVAEPNPSGKGNILTFKPKGVGTDLTDLSKGRAKDIIDTYAIIFTYNGADRANAWAKAYGFTDEQIAKLMAMAKEAPPEMGWEFIPEPGKTKMPSLNSRTPHSVYVSYPSYLSNKTATINSILADAGLSQLSPSKGSMVISQSHGVTSVASRGDYPYSPSRLTPSLSSLAPSRASSVVSAGYPVSRVPSISKSISKSTPLKSTSYKSTPSKSTPSKSTPSKTTPSKSTPSKSTPSKSTPSKSTPSKSTPSKSTPSKSTPSKSTPSKSTPFIPWLPTFSGDKKQAKQLIKGSVCFKMGELSGKGVWWILYPPEYGFNAGPGVGEGKAVWVHETPPTGVRVESGLRSAYRTIQKLGGAVPATITGSVGFSKYSIAKGEAIVFEPDRASSRIVPIRYNVRKGPSVKRKEVKPRLSR